MKFDFLRVVAASALACCVLNGCQPWRQLNENAVGQGGSVASLMEKLAVQNLVLFHANPHAIPSQINVNAGSVSTTDQGNISANDPVTQSITRTVAAATTVTTGIGSHAITPALSNQQVQNWTLEPVTAPDKLARLTALYRYVTVPGADLCRDYPEVRVAASAPPDAANDSSSTADVTAWSAATTVDTVDAYDAYKAAFPRGMHVDAANLREDQVNRKPPASEEQDETDWAAALKADNPLSYAGYMRKHEKNGHYLALAAQRIKQLIASFAPKPKKVAPDFVPDESLLIEPDCIKCSRRANMGNTVAIGPLRGVGYCPGSRDIYINARLIYNRWLAIVPNGTAIPSDLTFVGSSAGFDTYTENPAFWHQFVLAIQQATETGSGVVPGGKSVASGTSKPKGTTTLILPAQAVPLL